MSRLPSWARLSVRQRITVAVAVLTATALAAVGITVYLVENGRIARSVDDSLRVEISEFRTLVTEGLDPETRQPFASPDRVLQLFLERNYAAANETLWAFRTDGRVAYNGDANAELQGSREFTDLVQAAMAEGGLFELTVDGRDYRVAVQGVGAESPDAALVVTHDMSAQRADLRDALVTYALVASLALLITCSVASFLAGRLLKPVRALNDTAQSISAGDLSRRIDVTGNDDLTELQITFNAMLDRLEHAFTAQRQLLDDAGHELRTPLTVVRGHLDVLDESDPDDVAATRDLIIDETDRMARLVGELLMLAKARRPDFVSPEPIHVGQFLIDVLAKAQALGERSWTLDSRNDVVAALDGQRLTQALLQLADNAVKHTAAGDEIGLGAQAEGSWIHLWVRDTGPGVDPAERETVFDRFHRGLESDDGGFGLGLSIVQAIAQAHGGSVTIDDTEVGATFRISVPWVRLDEGEHR